MLHGTPRFPSSSPVLYILSASGCRRHEDRTDPKNRGNAIGRENIFMTFPSIAGCTSRTLVPSEPGISLQRPSPFRPAWNAENWSAGGTRSGERISGQRISSLPQI